MTGDRNVGAENERPPIMPRALVGISLQARMKLKLRIPTKPVKTIRLVIAATPCQGCHGRRICNDPTVIPLGSATASINVG